jgi:hypothetical protein
MTIVSMIVARWLAEHTDDAPVPDVDGMLRFCHDQFGSVPSQAQAIAARNALLAVRGGR